MKGSSFKYLLKEGVKNLWTNRVMAFTSIGVLTTCLLIVGAAYLITVNVDNMVHFVEGENEMSVIVKDIDPVSAGDTVASKEEPVAEGDTGTPEEPPVETPSAEGGGTASGEPSTDVVIPEPSPERKQKVEEIRKTIEAMPNIKSCTYISKEQGLENIKDSFGDSGYLLDDIKDRNYIPDTFTVTMKELDQLHETKAQLEAIDGVDSVKAATEVSDTLTYVRSTINTLGLAIIGALAIISLVIVANTIRATIFARRKEINIMKFVGATNSFIRIPFVVEGFMLGLISALIAYLLIWGSYSYLIQAFTTDISAWLNSMFDSIIQFKDIAPSLALFFGLTGTVLGSLGSLISIRNHVKV